MSLNDISLPPMLIAQLYQNTLIEGSAMPVPQKKKVSYLGKAEKNILILVNHKSVPFLPAKELEFLSMVLAACGLDLSHVAIVNWQHAEEKDASVLHQLSPKEILFLDVAPDVVGLPSAVNEYAVQKAGAIQFVVAPSLTQIEKTKQAKSQLWIALKQLFCL
jgi:DNA polymerase III psi subunit